MKVDTFFENTESLFEDKEDDRVLIPAFVFRNKDGVVSEIRIYNEKYDDILIINRKGEVDAINADEFKTST